MISVIIPAYNRAKTIESAIRSVLAQTVQDFEILVVNDASTDTTEQIVSALALQDQRIRYLTHQTNQRAQAARNTGIRAARGEWIAFLDSDDHWFPESLRMRMASAQTNNAQIVYSACKVCYADRTIDDFPIPPVSGNVYSAFLCKPGPMFQSLLIAKEALERIGYLDENVPSFQEWDTSIRLAEHYTFAFVEQPTFLYDCRGHDTMSKNKLLDAVGYEYIVKKHSQAILREVGHKALSDHYLNIASRYLATGNVRRAWQYKMQAVWHWPLHLTMIFRKIYQGIVHEVIY